jgi:hypothetical protein
VSEPVADWEREFLNSPQYQRQQDAGCLRAAASILEARTAKRTFGLRVVVKVLRNTADRLESQR